MCFQPAIGGCGGEPEEAAVWDDSGAAEGVEQPSRRTP